MLETAAAKWASVCFLMLCTLGGISPRHPPFYCNDTSISWAFTGDTINIFELFFALLLGPAFIFAMAEYFIHKPTNKDYYKQFKITFKQYLNGILYVCVIVEAGKTFISELRPHFIASCAPDWNAINCSAGIVTDYKCTGTGPDWLVKRDIYKSFPSGHAALSVYAFIYIRFYSEFRLKLQNLQKWGYWAQFVSLIFAFFCCISRITDNRHHWWDVIIGLVLGVVWGYITVFTMVQNKFIPNNEVETKAMDQLENAEKFPNKRL